MAPRTLSWPSISCGVSTQRVLVAAFTLFVAVRTLSLLPTGPRVTRDALSPTGGPCDNGMETELLEIPGPPPQSLRPLLPLRVARVVLMTHAAAPDRAAAVAAGWARPRCLRLVGAVADDGAPLGHVAVSPFFFTAAPAMAGFDWAAAGVAADCVLRLPENTSGAVRTARALSAAHARFPDLAWLIKADDDTLVHVGRFVRALLLRDDAQPHLVGSLMLESFPRLVSGGAGYALSGAAVRALAPSMDSCVDAHHEVGRGTHFEDAMVTWCARARFGDASIADEPGLNYNSPEQMVASGTFVDAKALADPITFHNISSERAAAQNEPRVPLLLTQVWPFGHDVRGVVEAHDAGVSTLAANAATCRAAAAEAGMEYSLVQAADSGALPLTSRALGALAPQARELLARLELLYARGGVSVSLWAPCAVRGGGGGGPPGAEVRPVAAAAEARRTARAGRTLPLRVVDPLGSTGFGSATGHALACAPGVRDVGGACVIAAATQFSQSTLRLLAALLQAAELRSAAWPSRPLGVTDAPFVSWMARASTVRALSNELRAPIVAFGGDAGSAPRSLLSLARWLPPWIAPRAADGGAAGAEDALPPLRVAQQSMWAGIAPVLGELEVLSRVMHAAVGRRLVPVDAALTQEQQLDAADVILLGPYGELVTTVAVARRYAARALTIFIGSENQWGGGYHDQLVGEVHVSLGHRRDLVAPNYLRLPWWLPYALDIGPGASPDRVRFSPLLTAAGAGHGVAEAAAWAARPRAAAILSSHYAYPRRALFEMLTTAGIAVDAPGKAFHNTEWPADLPNSHLNGKVEFLGRYRFNVCPENSVSGGGGYSTEKLAQALMAGTVPIFWGDAFDREVFNPRRVIVYDGANNASVLATIASLEADPGARAAWFAEPVLAPTARTWLRVWGGVAGELFRAGLALVRVPPPVST